MWRTWEEILDLFRRAERAGFDAALVTDHFLSDWEGEGGDVLEAWTLLAALAREVPRIQIGTYVVSVTHREPAVLAKQAVTVDHLSDGRLILGVGAGWNEREHQAYGIEFPTPRDRVDLVGETLAAIRLLETEERPSFGGDHVALVEAPFLPRPVNGHIPILIGSRRPRMLRHVARYADYWDLADSTEDQIGELTATVAEECVRIGRDPDEIVWMHEEIAKPGDPGGDLLARVERLAPLGVSFFLVNIWPRRPPSLVDDIGATLSRLRDVSDQ
jgi:alkanesulfonate monooxygenase SsuD/methylene tetrahydromethanopterin reductase-like flavin-dependent oxidoreductase (luciferase family)